MFYHDFVAPIAPALIIRAFDAPDSKIRHPFKKKIDSLPNDHRKYLFGV